MRSCRWLRVVVAAAALLGCVHLLLLQVAQPGDRFFAFVYERSLVQHVTLLVASIVIVLLFARLRRYRWNHRCLKSLRHGQGTPPDDLVEQLDAVSSTLREHGLEAAASRAEQIAENHAERIHKAYETINFLAGALPALGLFGTMLGLSNSLFIAFSTGSQGSQSVQTFVTALSTAMDTTVLAMACAVPLFGCAWLFGRLEGELADRYADYVRKQFALDEIPPGDTTTSTLHSELRRVTNRLTTEAKAAFGQLLEVSATAYRQTLEQVIEDVFAHQRRRDSEMVKRVAAEVANSLGQSVNRVGDLVQRQNGRLAEGVIDQVGKLEKVLRNRTPEEVVIRYQRNGSTPKE